MMAVISSVVFALGRFEIDLKLDPLPDSWDLQRVRSYAGFLALTVCGVMCTLPPFPRERKFARLFPSEEDKRGDDPSFLPPSSLLEIVV